MNKEQSFPRYTFHPHCATLVALAIARFGRDGVVRSSGGRRSFRNVTCICARH